MGKTNCPIQGGKIEEEKECLGFRIKDEIGKQGGFKVLTGNNERVLHFKALDSFPCMPVLEHEDEVNMLKDLIELMNQQIVQIAKERKNFVPVLELNRLIKKLEARQKAIFGLGKDKYKELFYQGKLLELDFMLYNLKELSLNKPKHDSVESCVKKGRLD